MVRRCATRSILLFTLVLTRKSGSFDSAGTHGLVCPGTAPIVPARHSGSALMAISPPIAPLTRSALRYGKKYPPTGKSPHTARHPHRHPAPRPNCNWRGTTALPRMSRSGCNTAATGTPPHSAAAPQNSPAGSAPAPKSPAPPARRPDTARQPSPPAPAPKPAPSRSAARRPAPWYCAADWSARAHPYSVPRAG